jgi:BirA family biotin operon repressor/biotin-[acetyl-CoA-carboxylase] ligase
VSKLSQISHAETPSSPGRLRQGELRRALLRPGGLWSRIDVVGETGSTNDDLLAAARAGVAEGAVLTAEYQTSGRGRQGRSWHTRPGAALTFSVLLRPAAVPQSARGWLPLLTGVAVVRALRAVAGLEAAALKWPNDVLVDGAKLAGILAEQAGDAIVVGVGLNVGARRDELPPARPGALPPTSLALLGAGIGRDELLVAALGELEHWYRRWARPAPGDADGSGLRAEYLECCATIGRTVRVELPGGAVLAGVASGIDRAGRLVVDTTDGTEAVSAGDVIHVR